MESPNKFKKIIGIRELRLLSAQGYFDVVCPDGTEFRFRMEDGLRVTVIEVDSEQARMIESIMGSPVPKGMVN